MPYILGIDTGGTNTDCAVIDSETRELIGSSKAFTTPEHLEIGISNALDGLPGYLLAETALVCLSTTLATNAIVEGKGCATGILLIGREPDQMLPSEHCCLLRGKLDIRGRERTTMSEPEIVAAVNDMKTKVEAIAISGFASVRNPVQEQKVKSIVERESSLPVFCAHELTSSLGFWERTVTAALNASLVKIIHDFIAETRNSLTAKGISAPIMIVRSDGTLMTENVARERPIDTILSGPAASILGARHLTHMDDAIILDMGGTTTDIADLNNGKVKLNPNGAKVGGWLTRCKAVDVSTHGIGGDSRIFIAPDGEIQVGPERVIPICLSHDLNGDIYLTPTDLLHITGAFSLWDREASLKALDRFAGILDISTGEALPLLFTAVKKRICLACIQATADFEGNDFDLNNDPASLYLLEKAFSNDKREFLHSSFYMQKPIIAVGAPVSAWMPEIAGILHGSNVHYQ